MAYEIEMKEISKKSSGLFDGIYLIRDVDSGIQKKVVVSDVVDPNAHINANTDLLYQASVDITDKPDFTPEVGAPTLAQANAAVDNITDLDSAKVYLKKLNKAIFKLLIKGR